jgi:CsoR family transcriptional regulator, copper-sensing transcriptional repressor
MSAQEQTSEQPPVRGYAANRDQILRRLARVEGQVRGVSQMIRDDRYCIDVLQQISAAQSALDRVALALVDDHTHHCVLNADGPGRAEMADELMTALGRLVTRR